MSPDNAAAPDVDAYIAAFPEGVREILERMRATIRAAAPDAEETISYAMPTFRLHGSLVHFAAFREHVGLYPAPVGIDRFEEELAPYRTGKGTLRFPLDRPVPWELVDRVVRFRAEQNRAKAAAKGKRR